MLKEGTSAMPKFKIDVHFDVYCARCGKGLCGNCNTNIESKSGLKMTIEPCQRCLDKEIKKAIRQERRKAKV
jgi:reverse gyrase